MGLSPVAFLLLCCNTNVSKVVSDLLGRMRGTRKIEMELQWRSLVGSDRPETIAGRGCKIDYCCREVTRSPVELELSQPVVQAVDGGGDGWSLFRVCWTKMLAARREIGDSNPFPR